MHVFGAKIATQNRKKKNMKRFFSVKIINQKICSVKHIETKIVPISDFSMQGREEGKKHTYTPNPLITTTSATKVVFLWSEKRRKKRAKNAN